MVAAAKDPVLAARHSELMEAVGERLAPRALPRRTWRQVDRGWAKVEILASGANTLQGETGVLSGAIRDPDRDWWRVGAPAPEGSYVLVRVDDDAVELHSDFACSRSLWYYADEERFIAATSQRAVVALLGSFQANEEALSWMLANGNIGFQNAWDRRIRLLRPNTRLRLSRALWQLEEQAATSEDAVEQDLSEPGQLMAHLGAVLKDMQLSPDRWALSLSGGVDCRAILGALPTGQWTAISWGSRPTDEPGTDLYVARQLASRYGATHRVFPLKLAADVEAMLNDFVEHGEGRTDKLAGYIDGFAVWRQLVESGVDGVIRGDELFGSNYVVSRALSWANMGLATFSDFATTSETRLLARIYPQRRPDELKRRRSETMSAWRNRLREQQEQPTILAALNQIRSQYVEMVNPLLCRSLVLAARGWSDDMTINKRFLRSIVEQLVPDLPFAERPSIISRPQVFVEPAMQELLIDHLRSQQCQGLFPRSIRDRVERELQSSGETGSDMLRTLSIKLRRIVAFREGRVHLKGALPVLDLRNLALRAFIANKAKAMFAADSQLATNVH